MPAPQVIDPGDYLTEGEVLARWPRLTRAELRRARKANPPLIGHYAFRGGPGFTPAQVQDYIDRTYLRVPPCPVQSPAARDSRSGSTISTAPIPTAAVPGMPAGMTPELARSAAAALIRQTLKPPKSRLPRSSQPPRKVPRKPAHLALVKS